MVKKGNRARITTENEAEIYYHATTSSLQRTQLAEKLQREIKWIGPTPQIEVLERKISKYRKHSIDGPEEKPWSTTTLDNYPIPPGALAAVLMVWRYRVMKEDTFTIREAKWAARLSGYIKTDVEGSGIQNAAIKHLSEKAYQYARTELMYKLIGQQFDSTNLDTLLMGLPMSFTGDLISLLPFLAEERGDKEKGIKDGVAQIRSLYSHKKRGKAR